MRGTGKLLTALVAAAGLCGAGSVSAASFSTYSTFSDWQTAALLVGSPIINEDFADSTLATGLTITLGGNSPTGTIGGGIYHDVALTQFNAKNPVLNFSPGTLAVGADWDFTPGGAGDGIVLQMSTGDTLFIGNPPQGAFVGFFGFVSDTAITSIRLDSPQTGLEEFQSTDLWFLGQGQGGGGGTAPEPTPVWLLALALLGIWISRRTVNH